MGIRREEEMEMSDDENCDSPTKKMRVDESGNADDCHIPGRCPVISLIPGGACIWGDDHITYVYFSYSKLPSLSDSACY